LKHNSMVARLLESVAGHPNFSDWKRKGRLSGGIIKGFCNSLRKESSYTELPSFIYGSAMSQSEEIFNSWLDIQSNNTFKLEGQQEWLSFLKSDQELMEESGFSIEEIQGKAKEVIAQSASMTVKILLNTLIKLHGISQDNLTRASLCYLIKNRGKIPARPENLKAFSMFRSKVIKKIERLSKQLEANVPKARELSRERWLHTLDIASSTAPSSEEVAQEWQNILMEEPDSVPLPITFESCQILKWSKDLQGRLIVQFMGMKGLAFKVYCDNRQLNYYQSFYKDQQTKKDGKNKHSSGLYLLRSAQLIWQSQKGKGSPWDVNNLALHCCIDNRLLTEEGTKEVVEEKSAKLTGLLTAMKSKENLDANQKVFIAQKESTLTRLNTSYNRPSRNVYKGQSNILIGVAMSSQELATIAVLDGISGKVLAYRNIKQLLGDNFGLLNLHHQQRKRLAHIRHKSKMAYSSCKKESELSQYIDKVLTKAIIKVAIEYQAGSIVLPSLKDITESIEIDLQTKAQEKIPNCLIAQKNYMKSCRKNIRKWSYNRLIGNITAVAHCNKLNVELGQQIVRGSPIEQAKDLAISAYSLRQFKN